MSNAIYILQSLVEGTIMEINGDLISLLLNQLIELQTATFQIATENQKYIKQIMKRMAIGGEEGVFRHDLINDLEAFNKFEKRLRTDGEYVENIVSILGRKVLLTGSIVILTS